MRLHVLTAVVLGALSSGCYRVTVITGAPPAEAAAPTPTQPLQVVDFPWQKSFVYGLVPPPEINTKEKCPQGFAIVETERSFLNGLVGAITYSIFTPMHAKVTCASGPVAK